MVAYPRNHYPNQPAAGNVSSPLLSARDHRGIVAELDARPRPGSRVFPGCQSRFCHMDEKVSSSFLFRDRSHAVGPGGLSRVCRCNTRT
jgi:hypothetical protein